MRDTTAITNNTDNVLHHEWEQEKNLKKENRKSRGEFASNIDALFYGTICCMACALNIKM